MSHLLGGFRAGSAIVAAVARMARVTFRPAGHDVDVARVPGFARGLDFIGSVAFIGLSRLRETNALIDILITEDNGERLSGVWAVEIVTGRTLALFKFTGGVQEIFVVRALPATRSPEIVLESDLLATSCALPDEALRAVRFASPVAVHCVCAVASMHGDDMTRWARPG
jgi:hypothetical protein